MLSNIGHIELDLPERPEKAPLPPLHPTDPYSRYGPKSEISHIFRVPEKLPAKQLSLIFLGLIVLPFIAFLIGVSLLSLVNRFRNVNPKKHHYICFTTLIQNVFFFSVQLTRLGVNIKSFPSSVGAATSALLFHGGIGAVLLLYVLFWLKASSQNRFLLVKDYTVHQNLMIISLNPAVGSVHDSKGTIFVGSVSVVRWTQNTL